MYSIYCKTFISLAQILLSKTSKGSLELKVTDAGAETLFSPPLQGGHSRGSAEGKEVSARHARRSHAKPSTLKLQCTDNKAVLQVLP